MADLYNLCPECARPVWHCDPATCADGARREAARQQPAEPDPDQIALALLDIDRRDRARGIT